MSNLSAISSRNNCNASSKIEAYGKNIKMVEAARAEAKIMIEKDPSLNAYPLIQQKLSHRQSETIHFE